MLGFYYFCFFSWFILFSGKQETDNHWSHIHFCFFHAFSVFECFENKNQEEGFQGCHCLCAACIRRDTDGGGKKKQRGFSSRATILFLLSITYTPWGHSTQHAAMLKGVCVGGRVETKLWPSGCCNLKWTLSLKE